MRLKIFLTALATLATIGSLYGLYKPLPNDLSYQSPTYRIDDDQIEFLYDLTYRQDGEVVTDHTIFDWIQQSITNAHDYVLLDMFLFNDQLGSTDIAHRPLATELATAIVDYDRADDGHYAAILTDPINTAYGSYHPQPLQLLQEQQVPLIFTDLSVLRDSNPLYSGWYRTTLQFLPSFGLQWLPNPFDPTHPKTTLSSYLRAFNFKANHRKVLLANTKNAEDVVWHGLVTSLNPHDASSRHSNIAVVIKNHPILHDLYRTEETVATFSDRSLQRPDINISTQRFTRDDMFIQLLTEKAIKQAALTMLAQTNEGDHVDLGMFYLSDRDIVRALKAADEREVRIRILLDPNRDAFGREKNGIPNRPVAHELMNHTEGNTTVRWCATSGEQCHSKLLRTQVGEVATVLLGSANFTRRNLGNYNLETAVRVQGTVNDSWQQEVKKFFLKQWENQDGLQYSTEYATYADRSWFKTLWYRVGEFTGISHY